MRSSPAGCGTNSDLPIPIQGHRKGAYWLTYFRMETEKVVGFNRACRLNENVLRNLTLRVDPRLVDTLVAHARGEAPPKPKVVEPPAERRLDDDETMKRRR